MPWTKPGRTFPVATPYGLHWSEVKASDILTVDGDGQRALEGDGEVERLRLRHPLAGPPGVPTGALPCMHTHMPYTTSLTSLEDGRLEPVTQNALRFHGDVAYDDDYNGIAEDIAEGARMAEVLGDNRVLFLAHHGVVVVGETIAQAFDDLYYLERACEVQVIAMSTGRPVKRIGDNHGRLGLRALERQGRQLRQDPLRRP